MLKADIYVGDEASRPPNLPQYLIQLYLNHSARTTSTLQD
jgi:hypothetical protein